MLISLDNLQIGARFLQKLPSFLRHPLRLDEARAILRGRLERREADFLALVHGTIYANPASPYRRLLAMAGGEYGDLERLVQTDGLARSEDMNSEGGFAPRPNLPPETGGAGEAGA